MNSTHREVNTAVLAVPVIRRDEAKFWWALGSLVSDQSFNKVHELVTERTLRLVEGAMEVSVKEYAESVEARMEAEEAAQEIEDALANPADEDRGRYDSLPDAVKELVDRRGWDPREIHPDYPADSYPYGKHLVAGPERREGYKAPSLTYCEGGAMAALGNTKQCAICQYRTNWLADWPDRHLREG